METKLKRNDQYSQLDPTEGKLIRIGHYLWKQYKAERTNNLLLACELVWKAKKEYRVELAAKRKRDAESRPRPQHWNLKQNPVEQATLAY